MNEIQRKVIEDLRRDILLNDGLGERFVHEYEYKLFEIRDEMLEFHGLLAPRPWVSLNTEVGSKGDEGTLASILCRTRRLIVIGVKGGVKSLYGTDRHGHKPVGYRNVLIYGKDRAFGSSKRSKKSTKVNEANENR